jgi:hypothetical protein
VRAFEFGSRTRRRPKRTDYAAACMRKWELAEDGGKREEVGRLVQIAVGLKINFPLIREKSAVL